MNIGIPVEGIDVSKDAISRSSTEVRDIRSRSGSLGIKLTRYWKNCEHRDVHRVDKLEPQDLARHHTHVSAVSWGAAGRAR